VPQLKPQWIEGKKGRGSIHLITPAHPLAESRTSAKLKPPTKAMPLKIYTPVLKNIHLTYYPLPHIVFSG
jgi:hypothetical protein